MTPAGPAPAAAPAPDGGDACARADLPSGAVLSCRGLRLEADAPAAPLTFEVRAGEAYGLLGRSGSGKTGVVAAACGLLAPAAGEVRVAGRDPRALDAEGLAATVGVVPDCAVVMPGRTVADNLGFWARVMGVRADLQAGRVAEALAAAGLAGRAGDAVGACPGGVQRRLGLAVALLHRPPLLVLDDPAAGIDERSGDELLAALARLRDAGTAILYATTEPDEVGWLCDRIGLLGDGDTWAEVRPDDLVATPAP